MDTPIIHPFLLTLMATPWHIIPSIESPPIVFTNHISEHLMFILYGKRRTIYENANPNALVRSQMALLGSSCYHLADNMMIQQRTREWVF